MSEEREDLTTIQFFNRQSPAKRLFLRLFGGVLVVGGLVGSGWAALQFIEEGTLATSTGVIGLGSILGAVVGGLFVHQSRFEYTDTTAS